MDYSNYIVKLRMDADELSAFNSILPLTGLCMTTKESNMICRLLGYQNRSELFIEGINTNPFLKNAFGILCFLYVSRQDSYTFNDFWKRLIFTDKEVEAKVRRTFNIREEEETLSVPMLESMWALPTHEDDN